LPQTTQLLFQQAQAQKRAQQREGAVEPMSSLLNISPHVNIPTGSDRIEGEQGGQLRRRVGVWQSLAEHCWPADCMCGACRPSCCCSCCPQSFGRVWQIYCLLWGHALWIRSCSR